jgi:protein-S-isoprenylcysteine O-methyltransferase Ste14
MSTEAPILNRAVVFGSGLLYWAGVWFQARRIRRRIGRSPNLRPRGARERLLWAGWFFVVMIWILQPLVAGTVSTWPGLRLNPALLQPALAATGILIILAGYAGTLWCYAAMGDKWRIGIDRNEKNSLIRSGPYRSVRHPIYLFQMVMLAGVALLLPSVLSLFALLLHLLCVWVKARDEEAYLLSVHGGEYRDYLSRTGRLFPSTGVK